jgi:hypothetical protein
MGSRRTATDEPAPHLSLSPITSVAARPRSVLFWLAGLPNAKKSLARWIFCNSKISARLIGALQFAPRLAICKMTTDELKQHLGD